MAMRQNRDKIGWTMFAFLAPTISLIIIGALKNEAPPLQISKAQQDISKLYENGTISFEEYQKQWAHIK